MAFFDSKYLLFIAWTVNQKLFSYAPAILVVAKWLKGGRDILKVILLSLILLESLHKDLIDVQLG